MIQTRLTIFDTARRLFKRLFKQGDTNPVAFKDTLYAVILNDMKEWEEYIGEAHPKMELILIQFLKSRSWFTLTRFKEELESHVDVNLPAPSWRRVWDMPGFKVYTPIKKEGVPTLYIWDGAAYKSAPYAETFDIVATMNPIKILIPTDKTLVSAVNKNFTPDVLTDLFERHDEVIYNKNNYNEYVLTLDSPLLEPIEIKLN